MCYNCRKCTGEVMETEIYLIRHGQSEADLLGVHEGRADFPLTSLGLKQADALADWLAREHPVDTLLSSPQKRAAQTAEAISKRLALPIHFDEDLMEYQNGLLAGLSYAKARELYPRPSFRAPHTRNYGMESTIDFRARAETALSRILYEYPANSRIAVVTHGGTISMLFRSLFKLPLAEPIWVATGDTAVHAFRMTNGETRVLFMNSQVHLESQ